VEPNKSLQSRVDNRKGGELTARLPLRKRYESGTVALFDRRSAAWNIGRSALKTQPNRAGSHELGKGAPRAILAWLFESPCNYSVK
jgi:hypothetical protein